MRQKSAEPLGGKKSIPVPMGVHPKDMTYAPINAQLQG